MIKRTGLWCLVVSLMTLSLVSAMPSSTTSPTSTTSRTNVSPIGDTIKQLADQLVNQNATSHLTFDTRTPPKVREQTRKEHAEIIEFSHPGVAEPVDDDALVLEEENKKMNFYKVDKPTTDSGLSTWILLSGQSSTNKPTKKPVTVTLKNTTVSNENKIIKPIFKRKSTTASTTKRPTSSSTTLEATIATTTVITDKNSKLTKLKTSLVNNNKTTPSSLRKVSSRSTTMKPLKTTVKSEISSTTNKSEFVKVPTKSTNSSGLQPEAKEGTLDLDLSVSPTSSENKKSKRPTGVELGTTSTKKKKNKNRRKKPIAEDKLDIVNGTKIATKTKEKPFGTQIYNYLSREVMPTVGVGLVGLMVTAGLASYFLYPFGPLRRSYNIDRKDKEGNYHYTDEYSGGIAEEEAIGKVIAGMPSNNYFNSNTRSHNSRNTYGLNEFTNGIANNNNNNPGGYQPNRFRDVDQRYMEGSVETVALNPMTSYRTEEVIIGSPKKNTYSNHKDFYEGFEKLETTKESVLNQEPDHDQFVVGNVPVPQDIVQVQATTEVIGGTPAVVPEHGPRTIEEFLDSKNEEEKEKVFVVESVPAHAEALYAIEHGPRRRRRQIRKVDQVKIDKEIDNEIDIGDKKLFEPSKSSTSTVNTLTSDDTTNDSIYTETTTLTDKYYTYASMNPILEKSESIFSLIKDLILLKLRLGLQMLQDKAESLTRYFKTVQERIDVTYKNVNQTISYS